MGHLYDESSKVRLRVMRFKCPHCGKETISVLDKIRIDPRHRIKCKECGRYINIPYYVLLIFAAIVFTVAYLMKVKLRTDWKYIAAALIGIAVMYKLIVIFCVPIIKK